jgi:hypothetical protein
VFTFYRVSPLAGPVGRKKRDLYEEEMAGNGPRADLLQPHFHKEVDRSRLEQAIQEQIQQDK